MQSREPGFLVQSSRQDEVCDSRQHCATPKAPGGDDDTFDQSYMAGTVYTL